MDYEKQLLAEARAALRSLPEHRCEIIAAYDLAVSEMEDGASAGGEYELFTSRIAELREEK